MRNDASPNRFAIPPRGTKKGSANINSKAHLFCAPWFRHTPNFSRTAPMNDVVYYFIYDIELNQCRMHVQSINLKFHIIFLLWPNFMQGKKNFDYFLIAT